MDPKRQQDIMTRILQAYSAAGGDKQKFGAAVSEIYRTLSPAEKQFVGDELRPVDGEFEDQIFKRLSDKYSYTAPGSQTDEQQKFGGQVTQQMSEFLNYLNQPVDLNSPYAQNILRGTAFNTMREAQLSGVRGGLSGASTERAVANAAMGLEAQRQDRLMQALGMGSGRDLGLQNVDLSRQAQAEQRYQFDVGQAYKQYQQNQQNQMAGLGLVGGVGGAVVGGLTGGPAGVMPGAQVGSQAFAGLGGLMYPTFSAPQRF